MGLSKVAVFSGHSINLSTQMESYSLKCGTAKFSGNQYRDFTVCEKSDSEVTQRLRKLIYLHLSTDCFMKISLHSLGPLSLSLSIAVHWALYHM